MLPGHCVWALCEACRELCVYTYVCIATCICTYEWIHKKVNVLHMYAYNYAHIRSFNVHTYVSTLFTRRHKVKYIHHMYVCTVCSVSPPAKIKGGEGYGAALLGT